MSRREVHLDAMLRHLGAAYYDSLHGRATEADVTRAAQEVAGHIGEPGGEQAATETLKAPAPHHPSHHGRHHSRVRDVMTAPVVTVDRLTSYKEIVSKLERHHIGGMPVLMLGRRVAGVVSGGDLVAAVARTPAKGGRLLRHHGHGAHPLTAEQLMTAPAVTIHPDAPIVSAARQMTEHHVSRLPVVDHDGILIGIVSRRDLLRLYLRQDAEIAGQVAEVLSEVLPEDPPTVTTTVREGIVTLAGHPDADGRSRLRLAVQLIADLDGVVDVIDKTASRQPA
jgi:CBS domain-containing protein